MQKLYYSISEVCNNVGEQPHILRYWEKEFPHLKPKKNRGGKRIYSEKDLLIVKAISKLIRTDKMSLQGALQRIERYVTDSNFSEHLENLINSRHLELQQLPFGTNDKEPQNNHGLYLSNEEAELLFEIMREFLRNLKRTNG